MLSVTADTFRLAQVFTIARGSRTEAHVLTVRAFADGVVGQGECVPYARYGETLDSVTAEIKGLPEGISRQDLQDALPAGAARNAVDCALWDLAAKQTGAPVWQLAGLPAPRPLITAYTLSLDTPENMRAEAAKHAHRPLLKIKLGTPDDMARLEAVREGAPKSPIIVDANEGWTAEVYADLAPHLLRLGVQIRVGAVRATATAALPDQRTLALTCYAATLAEGTRPTRQGVWDFRWVTLDAIGSYRFPPADAASLERLLEGR